MSAVSCSPALCSTAFLSVYREAAMTTDLVALLNRHRLIELSHVYEEGMPVWPGDGRFFLSSAENFATGDGNYNCQLSLGDHCGTHIDAPVHFMPHGESIDRVDIRQLVGRGRCLNMAHVLKNGAITFDMITEWEARNGEITAKDIVLFRTGYDKKWRCRPDHTGFMSGWPGLSARSADYLLEKGVTIFGTDALSLDCADSKDYPAHEAILGAGGLIIESLANLHSLPAAFVFIALPLRIKGGSASPVRAVAFVEQSEHD
ncbi:cyclase family protein [Erwinia sp.]|uniref:cyclase family protein n=1 Tax=Erwinia citreus TaxID=558 RepID=UPI00289C3464|nr:cyclase family protein [Erwinia sp.]